MQTSQKSGSAGNHRSALLIGLLATLALAWPALAQAALVTNGSFESGTYTLGSDGGADLAPASTAITGWTVISNHVAPLGAGNIYGIVAQNGGVSLDLQGYSDSAPYGGVSQVISTTVGDQYDLSFWIGVNNSRSDSVAPAGVTASADATAAQTFTNTSTLSGQQWEKFDYDFTATSSATTLTLLGASTAGGAYIGLDNVDVSDTSVVSSVPVPAAGWTGLVLLGILTIAHRRFGFLRN
jgi:hypothetical protein